jgi:hypothetical protein
MEPGSIPRPNLVVSVLRGRQIGGFIRSRRQSARTEQSPLDPK